MTSRWDTVTTSDGEMRCYVSVPAQADAAPAVIVIQHAVW
jgi:dienelactone hydrolase